MCRYLDLDLTAGEYKTISVHSLVTRFSLVQYELVETLETQCPFNTSEPHSIYCSFFDAFNVFSPTRRGAGI